MKYLDHYRDDLGIVGHRCDDGTWDFGDACARTYTYYTAEYLKASTTNKIASQMLLGMVFVLFWDNEINQPLRYPNRYKQNIRWWSMPDRFTRDQLIPMIVGLSFCASKDDLKFLFNTMVRRGGFCWNRWKIGGSPTEGFTPTITRDLMGPSSWGAFFRGFTIDSIWLRILLAPLLWLIDLWTTLQITFRCLKGWYDWDDTGDDLNLTWIVKQGAILSPTVVSAINSHMYFTARPWAGTQAMRLDLKPENGVVSAWQAYFLEQNSPPLDETMRPILKHTDTI